MKKIFAFVLSALLLFSAAAFAVDARSATETARGLAPEGSMYLYTEKDGKFYDVHFMNELTNEEFEISVPTDETRAIRIETENEFALGATQTTLSEDAARQAVLSEYPGAEIDTILTVRDDGLFEIHVYFKTVDRYGLLELNAENGTVLKRKIMLAAPESGWQTELSDDYYEHTRANEPAAPDNNNRTQPAQENPPSAPKAEDNSRDNQKNADLISVSRAKSAVTSSHPGAKITEIELDFEGGKYVYEGEAYLNGREYDFKVDARTGSLIKWKLDD